MKDLFGARTVDVRICTGYTSLSKYMPKYINQWAKEIRLYMNENLCKCHVTSIRSQ